MARRTRKRVLSTLRQRVFLFSLLLAALEVGALGKGDLLPGGGQLTKISLHLGWVLSWSALRNIQATRYLQRDQGGVPKSDAWFRWVMQNASEERFRGLFRMDRATFRAAQSVLRSRSCAPFFSRRGRRHLSLDVQLAIALYRLGHYGNACSVEAGALDSITATKQQTWRGGVRGKGILWEVGVLTTASVHAGGGGG